MNTTVKTVEPELEQQELISGWGSRLRETRLANKITLEEVSGQLHLDVKLLALIEAEDVERLPSPPFVKGYLRSYARLLDIDYQPIVEVYNELSLGDTPKLSRVNRLREISSNDKGPRYATWFVIAATVVLFLTWWSAVLSPVDKGMDAVTDVEQSEPAIETEVIINTPVEVFPEGISNDLISAPLAEIEQPETISPVSIAAPGGVINLEFKKDSWVEITDANNERLFLNTGKEGESRFVEGVPPFKILFGNSPAVVMEYNGEFYNHRVHESKGIARFVLEE